MKQVQYAPGIQGRNNQPQPREIKEGLKDKMPQMNLRKQAGTFSGSYIIYSECFSGVVWPEHSRTNSFNELYTGDDGRQDEYWTPKNSQER